MALYSASKAQISPLFAQFTMGAGANIVTLTLEPGPCVIAHVSAMNAAVRACLARGEAERAYVNDVERRADGSVSMRLRNADATQSTCAVTSGSQVSKFEAMVEPTESSIETPRFRHLGGCSATHLLNSRISLDTVSTTFVESRHDWNSRSTHRGKGATSARNHRRR